MTDERVIAYFLGELTGGDSERFEDELFAADEWPAEVTAIEDELIDAYLRGELPSERKELFENNYLCSEARLERVTINAAILRRIDELGPADPSLVRPDPTRSWWARLIARPLAPLALATAVLVMAAGVVWWVGLRGPQTFAELSLTLGNNSRSENNRQTEKVDLKGKYELRIHLTLPDEASSAPKYRVTVEDDNGRIIPSDKSGEDGRVLNVIIPANKLKPGGYEIKLYSLNGSGEEQRIPGSYFFDVE